MKRFLLTGLVFSAVAAAAPAQAADLPTKAPALRPAVVAPAPSWTGFYVGAGLGASWFQADGSIVSGTNNGVPLVNSTGCVNPGPGCATSTLSGTAFRVSGYAGYNWQIQQWLVGVEGDFGWADRTTTVVGELEPGGGFPFFVTNRSDDSFGIRTRWDASARARLGFLVMPTWLVYATGGAAWQRFDAISTCGPSASCNPGAFGPNVIVDSTTRLGWTVGGGIEALLGTNWIVRGEYRYADFGTVTNTDTRVCPAGVCGSPSVTTQLEVSSIRMRTQMATFGIAYKFGGEAAPVAAKY